MPALHDPVSAALRLSGCVVLTLLLAPVQLVLLGIGAVSWSRRNARWYWRGIAALIGVRVILRGGFSGRMPVLYVANHASYLDIIALGSVLDAAFVSKLEVKGWPGIGLIARLGRTVFVDRHPRKSLAHRDEMLERLTRARESLILFPEGTSSDGNRVRGFKSALFSAAEVNDASGKPLAVQPVTVAYTALDGMPVGRGWRPFYTWFGAMALMPHLWRMAGLGNVTVEIELHPTTSLDQFSSRKGLADYCQQVVSRGHQAAISGRLPDPSAAAPELT